MAGKETWVPRVPASTAQGCSSGVWCQKDTTTQELAKGVDLLASLLSQRNVPHGVTVTWGQPTAPSLPGTEVPLKSNRSAGHKVTTPSCLIPDFSFWLLEGVSGRGQWGGHSNQARPCCEGSVTSPGLCRYGSRSTQGAQKCVYRYICNILSGIALFSNSVNVT